MTSPSVPRQGIDPSDPPRESDVLRSGDAPPTGAVTLAELIADSGPLPADAALECVQRLAERLTLTPRVSCESLAPSDVLIDDDGGVWLQQGDEGLATAPADRPRGMDRLGRLLAFLATGNDGHLADGSACNAADLPSPLSTVAGRLFSRNGACYGSYAELANEAAVLRGVASPAQISAAPVELLVLERQPDFEQLPDEGHDRTPRDEATQNSTTESQSTGSGLGVAMILAAAGGAVIAYFIWQAL